MITDEYCFIAFCIHPGKYPSAHALFPPEVTTKAIPTNTLSRDASDIMLLLVFPVGPGGRALPPEYHWLLLPACVSRCRLVLELHPGIQRSG